LERDEFSARVALLQESVREHQTRVIAVGIAMNGREKRLDQVGRGVGERA